MTRSEISNDTGSALTVALEPWAEEVVLQPKCSLTLSISGSVGYISHLDVAVGYIIIGFASGSKVKMSIAGKHIENKALQIPAP